jgi:hypothetical protein
MTKTVNHPPHYGGAENPYEVIKVLEAWMTPEEMRGFLKGNIHKHVARAMLKGDVEDHEKGAWYALYLVDFCKKFPPVPDGAAARQLGKSMELNARLKNEVRALAEWVSKVALSENKLDLTTLGNQLDAILRMS